MRNGVLLVNGQTCDAYGCIRDHEDMPEVDVPVGSYFVLGDNRPISCDSRDFGLVDESLLKGRVRARFWPLGDVALF
jgi:signal peptidase I